MFSHPSPVAVPAAEQHWVDVARQIAQDAAQTVATDDLEARLPVEALRALQASGLDAAFLPRELGGEALSYITLGTIVRELARQHPALATVWLMHLGAAHALASMAPPEAREFFAGELRAGKRFANALSEPAGGNHFLASQQDATPAGEDFTLTGRKLFVSGSEIADYLFLNARLPEFPGFFGVAVDETVSFPPIDETMGMRATRSRTVAFEGTPLLRSRLCGPPAPDYANLITVGFGFISIGIAEAALDALAAVAGVAKGGARLADAEWVRQEVGLAWTGLQAATLLAERTAWLADIRSPEAMPAATESKMLANEVAKQTAALAVRVAGGGGYLLRSPVQRIFRDAQAGALMAYSVPFSSALVGGVVLGAAGA